VPNTAIETLPEDEFEHALPGFVLTHVLTVTSKDQLSIAIEALQAVRASGGGLEALHLTRQAGTAEHRLKLVGLRAGQARLLSDRLAALPGVERATVEHQLLRR
jgi:hypothetical protein